MDALVLLLQVVVTVSVIAYALVPSRLVHVALALSPVITVFMPVVIVLAADQYGYAGLAVAATTNLGSLIAAFWFIGNRHALGRSLYGGTGLLVAVRNVPWRIRQTSKRLSSQRA